MTPLIDIPKRQYIALVFADAEHKTPVAAYNLAWHCREGKQWKPDGGFLGALTEYNGDKRPRAGCLLPVNIEGDTRVYHMAEAATTALSKMVKDNDLSAFPKNHIVLYPLPYDRSPEQIAALKALAERVHPAPFFTDELPPKGTEIFAVGRVYTRTE